MKVFSISSIDQEVNEICEASLNHISSDKLNFKTIQRETQHDAALSKIVVGLQNKTSNSEFSINNNVL